MIPTEKMSTRPSTRFASSICSGAMYATVPMTAPVFVIGCALADAVPSPLYAPTLDTPDRKSVV